MSLVQIEKRKRGVFGRLVAFAFWGWNALMVVWVFGAMISASSHIAHYASDAEKVDLCRRCIDPAVKWRAAPAIPTTSVRSDTPAPR
jgi:hypothetical protein